MPTRFNPLILGAMSAVHTAQKETGFYLLDGVSRSILLHIANCEANAERVTMMSLDEGKPFGSYPTLQGRVRKLLAEEWLTLVVDPEDFRTKALRLSEKAVRTFHDMSVRLEAYVREYCTSHAPIG